MVDIFLSDNFSSCLAVGSKNCDLIKFPNQQYKKGPPFRFLPNRIFFLFWAAKNLKISEENIENFSQINFESGDFNLDGLDNLDDLGDLDLDNFGENLDDDDFDFEQFDKISEDVSLIQFDLTFFLTLNDFLKFLNIFKLQNECSNLLSENDDILSPNVDEGKNNFKFEFTWIILIWIISIIFYIFRQYR